MRFGVLQFPGSNCDADALHALRDTLGIDAEYVWHKAVGTLGQYDALVVPGGFSYGDYLRCGAIARFSPVMGGLVEYADSGRPVIGICNGFQILCESGLLPGALLRNRSLHFVCRTVNLRVEHAETAFTRGMARGDIIRLPIAHGEGCYVAEDRVLDELEAEGRILFRYCTDGGEVEDEANPNGSVRGIAGICNAGRNVLGLMPHPERACDPILGRPDGARIFRAMESAIGEGSLV